MKILINIPYDGSLCIESSDVNTIKNVKEQISELKGIPCDSQKLYKNGRLLEDEDIIEVDQCEYEYTIDLNFSLLGGGKKKKKKVYKKPKKEKHKKKKVKLAILKFYKVGDDGKVFRLKKQCNNCVPGTLMASHFNRDYCGRCHLTIMKK
ncbi:ubiquitin-40S ribosomal protein S27a, putative [Plasmodium vinckei vinckei]|uniref:Ubiquitin-40S ribosomal protein S27a, putative n=1 Tax=Plasmodium vinckei vinckei TaxID=54757 RepID=A0A449BUK3_PLAVN|nr:ubiquitin-40S ribosomal protein S27a, putative [Plasmodium vinckei vinckei]KEG03297.1 hypothetical protein YYE_02231 [Plasmodium vinckei vinckei]VEV57101.1 ubiquitin-40S ribosomal protein S27a, putative [Plasmodium vinckei vinckei]